MSGMLQTSCPTLGLWLTDALDREAHAAGRLDVLSAWAVRSDDQPLLGWKRNLYIKRIYGLYCSFGSYNSVPVVLHL
jgi:hypothetical protein